MDKTIIFHVLAKRSVKTLCGAVRTRNDEVFSWNHAAVGVYVPCEECLRIKREANKTKKQGV